MSFVRAAKVLGMAALVLAACGGGGESTTGATDGATSSDTGAGSTSGAVTTSTSTTASETTSTTGGSPTTGGPGDPSTGSPLPPPDALWARSLGGAGDDYGKNLEVVADGAIRVGVDGNPDIMGQPVGGSAVVQYDVDGNLQQFFTGQGLSVWVSAQDGGLFAGVRPNNDPSIARFDPTGQLVWTTSLQNVDGNAGTTGIGRLSGGEVIAGGIYSGSIAGAMGTHTSAGARDGFIARIADDGSLVWSKSFGDVGTDVVRTLAIDSQDRVIVLGYFQDAIDLEGTPLTAMGDGAFLAAYSADGQLAWAETVNAFAIEIAIAPDDGILVLRSELGPANVSRFEPDGTPGTLSIDTLTWGESVASDASGRIYVVGLTPGPPDTRVTYVRVFDPAGTLLDDRYYPGTALYANRVAAHPSGAIIVSGGFEATADFGSDVLSSVGASDAFLALLPGVP